MWSFYPDHVPDYPFFRLMGPPTSTANSDSSAQVEGISGPHPGGEPPMAHRRHDLPVLPPPPPPHTSHSLFGGSSVLPSPTLPSRSGNGQLHSLGAIPDTNTIRNLTNHLGTVGLGHSQQAPSSPSVGGVPAEVNSRGAPMSSPPIGNDNTTNEGHSSITTSVASSNAPTTTTRKMIKSYHCKMCDQIFDNKSDALLHNQTVHKADPKPYRCGTCSKTFANSSYLSQHARIHAGLKPYKCQICDRRFTQLCHLQQHIRTHTGEKPYCCQHPGCAKAFSQLSNLQSHSRSHMTDRPFRCNSCYKCFTDEQALREHIPKHSETKHLKTHICRICGKSYTQETYLARHMTKHQGADPATNMLDLTTLRQQQAAAPVQRSASQPAANQSRHSQNHTSQSERVSPNLPTVSPSQLPFHHSLSLDTGSSTISGGPAGTNSNSGRLTLADIPDIKPFLEGAAASLFDGSLAGMESVGKGSSAFMPLSHQFPGQIAMTSVSSNFPFSSPPNPQQRFPHSNNNPTPGAHTPQSPVAAQSRLSRMSPPLNSPQHHSHHNPTYFPFDKLDFTAKRGEGIEPRVPQANAGVLASSLLRLQQIHQFNSSHPVFPKGEPSRDFPPSHATMHNKNFGMPKDFL